MGKSYGTRKQPVAIAWCLRLQSFGLADLGLTLILTQPLSILTVACSWSGLGVYILCLIYSSAQPREEKNFPHFVLEEIKTWRE